MRVWGVCAVGGVGDWGRSAAHAPGASGGQPQPQMGAAIGVAPIVAQPGARRIPARFRSGWAAVQQRPVRGLPHGVGCLGGCRPARPRAAARRAHSHLGFQTFSDFLGVRHSMVRGCGSPPGCAGGSGGSRPSISTSRCSASATCKGRGWRGRLSTSGLGAQVRLAGRLLSLATARRCGRGIVGKPEVENANASCVGGTAIA